MKYANSRYIIYGDNNPGHLQSLTDLGGSRACALVEQRQLQVIRECARNVMICSTV